ncbi:MAG: UvrD-helicase domain-containing protein [Chloroflexi bacterium]|nr:UvrD-helicase domain-containing protein [Chloroflexota bacterium]
MDNTARERAIAGFHLTDSQHAAALERGRDVVVTAGAGCGKTSTLVARYVSLLADGCTPRSILAVTFTEKAAREMRSRVRRAVSALSVSAASEDERQRWSVLASTLDAARIGTIHSLCAEMLRAHPAEAGIDPRFTVLTEADAALLCSQSVQDTLNELVETPGCEPLFSAFKAKQLEKLLTSLLTQRLDASELRGADLNPLEITSRRLNAALDDPVFSANIAELRALPHTELLRDAGDKLAPQVLALLDLWDTAIQALAAGEPFRAVGALYRARREGMSLRAGKQGRCKELIKELQGRYDELLDPLIGGRKADSQPPAVQDEERFIEVQRAAWQAYDMLLARYTAALRERQALDFDDLERGAHSLLSLPEVRSRWRNEFAAVLVDEFQDTNRRQREIVEALAGAPGRLFIVGDARQSIYRFRRADVTVFREVQAYTASHGGLSVDLDQSFRTHAALLEAAGELLAAAMGTADKPERPYEVPFTTLKAMRPQPESYLCAPHIELVLGAGANAESARPAAAQALAGRLLELRAEGQIRAWDEVALLLRSSSGFSAYEDAFERAGIPFVTVAGRGMYDRPEIRDVLNILGALADPTDDLALAGLLRSPAFGLSDAALYQLRWRNDQPTPYSESLAQDLSILAKEDRRQAQRANAILAELYEIVDRVPVAELLQRLVMASDYRAILALDNRSDSGGRLWRNLDKLISDAQSSQQILVRDFLDYIAQLDDVSAREGEAPAEALASVRLMTIHRAKGLEFPVVVLADASRRPPAAKNACLLLQDYGLTFQLKRPALFPRLAERSNALQEAAERSRLLYVALTRARDKLIISGHLTISEDGKAAAAGWLKELCAAAGVEPDMLCNKPGEAHILTTPCGHPVRAVLADTAETAASTPGPVSAWPESDAEPLYKPLPMSEPPLLSPDEPEEAHPWSISRAGQVPPEALGLMVHKALELWLFPGDARLRPLLTSAAQSVGLVLPEQQAEAASQAEHLLARLHKHPLYQEIADAAERLHEVPYIRQVSGRAEAGVIDLLYRVNGTWQIIDFKTDCISSEAERSAKIEQYSAQMRRYASAASELLRTRVRVQLCFLDDHGQISLVPFD